MTAMRPASAFSSPCSVQIGFPALLKMKTCFLCCFHAADTPPCPSACNREDWICWAAEEEEQQGGDERETDIEVGKEAFMHTTGCEHHEQAVVPSTGRNMQYCQLGVCPCTLLDVQGAVYKPASSLIQISVKTLLHLDNNTYVSVGRG